LPGGNLFWGNYPVRKSASGVLYLGSDQATYRVQGQRIESVMTYPLTLGDGVTFNSPFSFSVNDGGQIAMLSSTNQAHQRLVIWDGAQARTAGFFNGAGPFVTASPAGGTFASVSELAINEAGQTAAILNVNGGPSGIFLYEGNEWRTLCPYNTCQIDGEFITSARDLKTAGNRFCFYLTPRSGTVRVDCWENGAWSNLIRRGDMTADGTEVNSLATYDVNRNGDFAMVANTNYASPSLFVRRGGADRVVQSMPVLPPGGAPLVNIPSVDLKDDGRVYFTALDAQDRMWVYEAKPNR
jgi:hypothetical protein